jgi:hypothetical protein
MPGFIEFLSTCHPQEAFNPKKGNANQTFNMVQLGNLSEKSRW